MYEFEISFNYIRISFRGRSLPMEKTCKNAWIDRIPLLGIRMLLTEENVHVFLSRNLRDQSEVGVSKPSVVFLLREKVKLHHFRKKKKKY